MCDHGAAPLSPVVNEISRERPTLNLQHMGMERSRVEESDDASPLQAKRSPSRISDVSGGNRMPGKDTLALKNSWTFSRSELKKASPSVLDSMSPKEEIVLRAKGINFIIQVGNQLKLPPMTIYAASTFLHRFYMRHSLKKFHYYAIGGTCVLLATKVEETNRRLRDVSIACTRVANKNPTMNVDEQSKDFWKWKDSLIFNEEILLEALCFDLLLESPYQFVSQTLERFDMSAVDEFYRQCYTFINDSCRTTLCLHYSARLIGAAAVYCTTKSLKMGIASDPPWYQVLDIPRQEIIEVVNTMADLVEDLRKYVPQGKELIKPYLRVEAVASIAPSRAGSVPLTPGQTPSGADERS